MPTAVTSVFARLKAGVGSFTVAQRTIAIIGVAVLAMGAFALTSWLTRPAMSPLFSGLGAEDASAVVEQLRAASVPYELADGGTSVLVPEAAVYEQRLTAAAAGLPRGRTDGYSLFDAMGVTSSEFQQSVTYKRAIEGELARTIGAIEAVRTASVQLAIPEESVFVSETVDPTASVFIETVGGTTLPAAQVEAIVHLTSAAVSGMKPENVAVIDSSGRTLSAIGGETTRSADEQTGAYEARTAAGLQQMLDTVVGKGNATVSVSAVMDNATTERIAETFQPVEGAPSTMEETSTETYTGTGGAPGVLGADVAVGGEGGTYESTRTSRDNVVNKTVESVVTPAGALTRQTVAVAVDREAAADIDVAGLTALVSSAAGINPIRGDAVTVELVTFNAGDAEAAQAALDAAREQEQATQNAAAVQTALLVGGLVLTVLAALVSVVVRRRRRRAKAVAPDVLTLTPTEDLSDRFDPLAATPATPEIESLTPDFLATAVLEPDPEPEISQVTLDRRRAEIGDFARRDPARAADLLRQLVRDRQDA